MEGVDNENYEALQYAHPIVIDPNCQMDQNGQLAMHDGQIYLPVVDMNYQMASPDQQLAQLDPACQDQRQLYYDNNTQQLLQAVPMQCLDAADQQLFDQH